MGAGLNFGLWGQIASIDCGASAHVCQQVSGVIVSAVCFLTTSTPLQHGVPHYPYLAVYNAPGHDAPLRVESREPDEIVAFLRQIAPDLPPPAPPEAVMQHEEL